MFDKSKILSNMYGIVGLRQPLTSAYAVLDANNIASRSGYYSNDNPFAKVELLYDCQDKIGITNADFNTLVKNMQVAAINDVCNEVFNESDYIDRNLLFIYPLNKTDLETLPSGFVGYKIEVCNEKNVAFEISRCLFAFSGTGTIKLLLMSSNQNTPMQSKTVTITANSHEESLKWVVDGSDKNYKARYYVGYLTNSITGNLVPYKRDFENSTLQSVLSYLKIEPIYIPNKTTETMWDLTTEEGNGENYFGINPDISVFYDYTDLILKNERLLAKAIDIAFQIKIMQYYIATTRSNRNQRIADDLITKAMAEIEGISEAPGTITKTGLKYLLMGEIRSIRAEIQKLRDGYSTTNRLTVVTLN